MNKRFLFAAVVTALVGGIEIAHAAYVIRLKNGNEYITARYWHEGGQVLFDTYGGVFGIEKSFVAKIEKTDQNFRLAAISDREPADKAPADVSKQNNDSGDSKPPATKKVEAKRDADDPIVGEFDRLKEKSKEIDGMLTNEIRELLKQITAFKNKLSKDSKLFIQYGREFNDANELGASVESALRARTQ
jgi:hypothetical protein